MLFVLSNSSHSFVAANFTFLALCTSTLLAQKTFHHWFFHLSFWMWLALLLAGSSCDHHLCHLQIVLQPFIFLFVAKFNYFYSEVVHLFFSVFHFALLWACNIEVITLFHYFGIGICHLILWTALHLFHTFLVSHHLESVPIWVPPSVPNSVTVGPSCFIVYCTHSSETMFFTFFLEIAQFLIVVCSFPEYLGDDWTV